jgi:hypothetical protein
MVDDDIRNAIAEFHMVVRILHTIPRDIFNQKII